MSTETTPLTEAQIAELERLEREAASAPWLLAARLTPAEFALVIAARNALPSLLAEVRASRSAPAPSSGEAVGALRADPDPYLLAALGAAADGLRSAATYLRHVNAFAFAEQVEIDENRARAALSPATTATPTTEPEGTNQP
jgi:hypothetical protein